MAFDLTEFGPRVRARAAEWDSLGLRWSVEPIHPNHGKALTWATFEGVAWLAQISVWESGETEVETMRTSNSQIINRHYDLEAVADLDIPISELIGLLRDDVRPPNAYIPDQR